MSERVSKLLDFCQSIADSLPDIITQARVWKARGEFDQLRADVDVLRGLLSKIIKPWVAIYKDGTKEFDFIEESGAAGGKVICRFCGTVLPKESRSHSLCTNPYCPAVRARAYLDGKLLEDGGENDENS